MKISFVLLATSLLGFASVATAQVNYGIDGNVAFVAGSPNASGNVVIAPTYNGYPVTYIAGYAFYNCTNLVSLTIPDSVNIIGWYAFTGCTSLTNATILGGVGYLGEDAFAGCTSLRSMTIPFGLPRIELRTFYGCTSLASVTIPNDVAKINVLAFYGCTSLTNVTLPDNADYIASYAFGGCSSLRSVTIGNATGIWGDAFAGCSGLTNFSVAASNPAYSSLDGVLFNKAQTGIFIFPFGRAGSYVIPSSVTGIGGLVFSACTSLTSVTIPDSVTSIGYSAFSGCASLGSVSIGNGVTIIQPGAFSGSTSLTNLSVAAANPAYSSLDGVLFNKVQTALVIFPPGRGGSYVIPDSVVSIGGSAFAGCPSLTSVTFGGSVTNTGVSAFAGCTSLTSVTIPNNVTGIGNASFNGCISLTSVTIPNSVGRIGFEAFINCASLTNLTFLGNAPVLTPYPTNSNGRWFPNVGAGARVYYSCGTTGWGATYGGLPTVMLCPSQINYAVSGGTAYVASSPNASGDVVIASTFNGYPVTSIGDRAFENCTSLTSVTIPDSVTQIGTTLSGGPLGFSFYNCTSLTNVIIGSNVTNIGYAAFVHCTSLTRLTIPASVINIASSAFAFCTSLTNVTFLGNPPRLLFDFEAGGYWFSNVGPGAKAYYYCGTTGWGGNYGGLPTVMLCPPGIASGGAGVKPGGFGFTLTRLTNQTVVEASTDLLNWQPIWTNTPPASSAEFVDPQWLQHPNRFYRARSE